MPNGSTDSSSLPFSREVLPSSRPEVLPLLPLPVTPLSATSETGSLTDGSYNVPKGLIFSFPVTVSNKKYSIVQGLKISEEAQKRIDLTTKELLEERKAVEHLLK